MLLPQTGARLSRVVAKPKQRQDNQSSQTRQSRSEDRNAPQNPKGLGNIKRGIRRSVIIPNFLREPEAPRHPPSRYSWKSACPSERYRLRPGRWGVGHPAGGSGTDRQGPGLLTNGERRRSRREVYHEQASLRLPRTLRLLCRGLRPRQREGLLRNEPLRLDPAREGLRV